MKADRKSMYKLPWSTQDSQGGWVEVTDRCNISCPGCYRQRLEGDRPLDEVKEDISKCLKVTNCDTMVIAGGEPLLYPYIIETVRHAASLGLKPLILSNGALLTRWLAYDLKEAGLKRIHFHIDSKQNGEDRAGKSERELNAIRQHYADMLYEMKGVQCGFHVTIGKDTLSEIPAIMEWYLSNMHKVQHLSLIALSGVPVIKGYSYVAGGTGIPADDLVNKYPDISEISITTDEILDIIQRSNPGYTPSAYIGGDSLPGLNKQLFVVGIGSSKGLYGVAGAKTMELTQAYSRLFRGRYFSFNLKPAIGKKIFLLSPFDREIRKAFRNYLSQLRARPGLIFEKTWLQSMIIQQPIDFISGEKNVCDHCVNPMVYGDLVINPCELDEYRVYGNLILSVKQ